MSPDLVAGLTPREMQVFLWTSRNDALLSLGICNGIGRTEDTFGDALSSHGKFVLVAHPLALYPRPHSDMIRRRPAGSVSAC